LGNVTEFSLNERRAVAIAGVAADFDGAAMLLGRKAFDTYHHVALHNLLTVAVITLAAFVLFPRRLKLVLFCFMAAMLHLALDFFGSHWELELLRPFSGSAVSLVDFVPKWLVMYLFQGIGIGLMFVLMVWVFVKKDRTFFEIFTSKGDRLVMRFLTLPWKERCGECGRRAFYQCSSCGAYMCMRHRMIARKWRILCEKCLAGDSQEAKAGSEPQLAEGDQ
jgi:hypothetical protein